MKSHNKNIFSRDHGNPVELRNIVLPILQTRGWIRFATAIAVFAVVSLLQSCATVPRDLPKTESSAIEHTIETHFGRAAEGWKQLHGDLSGFFPFANGIDALGARLYMIEKAEKIVDLQYFLMRDDRAGLVVQAALINAAERGVRIRLLLDDVFTSASDRSLLVLNQHPNIEVRLFNPVSRRGFYSLNFIGSFNKANRRMHNKSLTVDNAISIVGGRNIADEYFQLRDDAVFSDFDILAFGEIAKTISSSFDIYWNHELAIPIEHLLKESNSDALESERSRLVAEAKTAFEATYKEALSSDILQKLIIGEQDLFVANAVVISDDPNKLLNPVGGKHMRLAAEIDNILQHAERELIFISPYYVPGKDGVQYTRELTDKGVRIVILTNSLKANNHVAVHSAYSGYRKELIGAGVELFEVRANAGREAQGGKGPSMLTLHTKLILIDRRYLFVGSLNLDPRSLEINAEMGLLIDSEELVGLMAEGIEDILPSVAYRVLLNDRNHLEWRGVIGGKPVTENRDPLASWWLRFKSWFLKIVPEEQL